MFLKTIFFKNDFHQKMIVFKNTTVPCLGKTEESTPRHSPTAAGEMEEDDNTGVDVGSHEDTPIDDIHGLDPLEHSPTHPTPHRLVRKNRISHHKMQHPHPVHKIED